MTERPAKRRRMGLSKASATALLVAAGAVALVALVLVKATPDVYRRTRDTGPAPAAVAQFNERVVNRVGNVLLDKSGGTSLDIEVTEEMVNARIARFLADEAASGEVVPPVLARLRVAFEPGALVVATRVGDGLTSAVVSQYLGLSADDQGRLCVRPAGTDVGCLPLPSGVLDYARRAIAAALDRRQAEGADEKDLGLWRAILDGLDGKPIPLGKGRKCIRLEHVEMQRGVLRMRGSRQAAPKD